MVDVVRYFDALVAFGRSGCRPLVPNVIEYQLPGADFRVSGAC